MENSKGWGEIILFGILVFAGLCLSQFVGMLCLLPFYNFNTKEFLENFTHSEHNPGVKMQLLFLQGISSFTAFILIPLWFINRKHGSPMRYLYGPEEADKNFVIMLLAVAIMLVSMPFTGWFVYFNENISLPPSLKGIELWARQKEDSLKELTEMLTRLDNPFELTVGLLVIAVLPAIGEEMVFRGYLQNQLRRVTDQPHFAIWFSAIIFSAIHFQFFGFLPRMILGALFGYMYYFTGQFHLPVIGHFVNNGLTLVLIYLKNKGVIKYDIENEASVPVIAAAFSLLFTLVLFILLKNQFKRDVKKTENF